MMFSGIIYWQLYLFRLSAGAGKEWRNMKHFCKKIVCTVVCALLMMFAAAVPAQAEIYHCEGYGNGNAVDCLIVWNPTVNQQHYGVCHQHVTDKENPYSWYPPVAILPCALDAQGNCNVCGRRGVSANPTDLEALMIILHSGVTPVVTFAVSGASGELDFSQAAKDCLAEVGFSLSESASVSTEYTLKLAGGNSYPYTGEPIEPAALEVSAFGPASLLEELSIGEITYSNNINPGIATAKVEFVMGETVLGTLTTTFTITAESGSDEFTDQQLSSGGVDAWGSLSQGARLNVTPVSSSADRYKDLEKHPYAEGLKALAAFEVKLEGEYSGKIQLAFPVDPMYNGKQLTILHGKADGSVEKFLSTAANGKVDVEVEELSPFMILADGASNPLPPAGPGEGQPSGSDLPKTGDASQPLLWMMLMAVSLLGLHTVTNRRKLNKQ